MLGLKSVPVSFLSGCRGLRGTVASASRVTYILYSTEKTQADTDPVDEVKFGVSEEELEKKRFKSRLEDEVYRKFIKKEFLPPKNKEHFRKRELQKLYGRYGEESGLNPGIAWPTREELQEIIEHDKMFHTPLQEMLDKISAADQEKMRERLEYEAQVDKNMAKLEKLKKEYYDKIAKKKAAAVDAKLKQQQMIEQVSELLGYEVDPKDPKFQEAVEMKKTEEKKALKAKKQKESYERMVARLTNIAASRKKEEAESAAQEAQSEKPQEAHDSKQVQSEKPQGSKQT